MMDSTEGIMPSADYRVAHPASNGTARTVKTCRGPEQLRTATVPRTVRTVQMRVVPRPPRQGGDEATTG